jgi:hypothetical protein
LVRNRVGVGRLECNSQAIKPNQHAADPAVRRLREYAGRIISTPGTHDGLYWPPENQADISLLDGFAEDANLAGRSGEKPEPSTAITSAS